MTKTERENWDNYIQESLNSKNTNSVVLPLEEDREAICAADVYIRKLERELQALKHKKAVAAILQKKG